MRRTLAVVMVLILLMLGNNAAAVVQLPYSSEPTSALWKLYDPELHYWYQQLTEAEKRLFSARYDCIALGQADLWDYQNNCNFAPGDKRLRSGEFRKTAREIARETAKAL